MTPLTCTSPWRPSISAGPATRSSAHVVEGARDVRARPRRPRRPRRARCAPSPPCPAAPRVEVGLEPDSGSPDDAARSSSSRLVAMRRACRPRARPARGCGRRRRAPSPRSAGTRPCAARPAPRPARPGRSCTPPNAFSTSTGVPAATASRLLGVEGEGRPVELAAHHDQPQAPAPRRLRTRQAVSTVAPKARIRSSRPILRALHDDLRASRSTRERHQLQHAPHHEGQRPPARAAWPAGRAGRRWRAVQTTPSPMRVRPRTSRFRPKPDGPLPPLRCDRPPEEHERRRRSAAAASSGTSAVRRSQPRLFSRRSRPITAMADAPGRRLRVVLVRRRAAVPRAVDERRRCGRRRSGWRRR